MAGRRGGFSCHGSLPARPAQRNPWSGLSTVLCGSSSLRPNCQHKFIFFFIHLFICIYLLDVEGSPNSDDAKHLKKYFSTIVPSKESNPELLFFKLVFQMGSNAQDTYFKKCKKDIQYKVSLSHTPVSDHLVVIHSSRDISYIYMHKQVWVYLYLHIPVFIGIHI